jgi:glutamate/tyrosine decarboxylase-like PLP-dependent enzyme
VLRNTIGRFTTIDDSTLHELRRQCAEPLDHPDLAALQEFSGQALAWLLDQFSQLENLPVGQTASVAEMDALLGQPANDRGLAFASVFEEFKEKIARYAMRIDHPRFLAFVPTAPSFISVLGELLCAGTNFFGGVWLEAAGPSHVERVVIEWFKDWLGYPSSASGLLTSGGSEANLAALVVARERLSFEDRNRAVLYVPEQRHWSINRAAKIMGVRPEQIRPLPVDKQYRLVVSALDEACQADRGRGRIPWAVVANAGATNTGSIDPLEDLVSVGRSHRLWLHADAAYGWPIVLAPGGVELLAGIGECDSITLDPHKWFGQTYDAGCLLVKEEGRLAETFSLRPDYMRDVEPVGEEINYADLGLALTRRFRALKIWLSVRVLGLDWFRSLIIHGCRLAELSEALLRQYSEVEIVSPAQLSVVCFRIKPKRITAKGPDWEDYVNRFNEHLSEQVRVTGQAFMATTRLNGKVTQRFCFTNWRTTAADVERVIALLMKAATALS